MLNLGALCRRLARRCSPEHGFTLVELLMVMVIMSLVLGAIISLFLSGVRAQSNLTDSFEAETALHVALDRMRTDVHLACSETAQSASSVTLSDPPCDGTDVVTWCTRGGGSDYGLYRVSGSTCSGGVQLGDYLTSGSIFGYLAPDVTSTTPSTGSYAVARLHVDLTVDATPANPANGYRVVDDLAFRNSPRCTSGVNCPS
jgi:prepilin-type N-terminal cleavage/methylation domain-containing protein